MSDILKQIKRGTSDLPPRVLLAGPEGIGKSTFASKAPNPVFVCAEDGLTGFDHLPRFNPPTLDSLNLWLDALSGDPLGFKTVVVDTTDWLERLMAQSICVRDGKANIEDYGYGKGYVVLENELVIILKKLDDLRHKHKIGVVLLAHVHIRTFNDPRGESWDRYEMKGHKKVTGVLREWPDVNLFAVFEVFTKKKKDGKETTIGGDRIMHTQWSPAWDAKNRLNLPETLPLEWDAFEQAVKENSSASLISRVRALYKTAKIPEGDKPKYDKSFAGLESMTADRLKAAISKLESMQ